MDLAEIGMGEQPSIIKPEHLSAVISSSAADYLIVIGDRNMKNDTCEVRVGALPRARAKSRARLTPPPHPRPPPPAGAPRGEAR